MRRTLVLLGFASMIAAALASFALLPDSVSRTAQKDGPKTFLIPASDGYGVADCLSSGAACGKVVADAWCEAQGYNGATSFGNAAPEDMTGSVEIALRPQALSITCGN